MKTYVTRESRWALFVSCGFSFLVFMLSQESSVFSALELSEFDQGKRNLFLFSMENRALLNSPILKEAESSWVG